MQVANLPNIFVDQGQFSDPDFISGTHQRENVQFADKHVYYYYAVNSIDYFNIFVYRTNLL